MPLIKNIAVWVAGLLLVVSCNSAKKKTFTIEEADDMAKDFCKRINWDMIDSLPFEKQKEYLDSAIKASPTNPDWYYSRGNLYIPGQIGNFDTIFTYDSVAVAREDSFEMACLSKAIELDSNFLMAYQRLIIKLSLSGKSDKTLPYLLKLQEIFPEIVSIVNYDFFFYMWQGYFKTGNYEKALQYNNKEIEKYKNRKEVYAVCLMRRAETKCALGDKDGANADMHNGSKLYNDWKGYKENRISDTATFCK